MANGESPLELRMFIDGKGCAARSGKSYLSYDPCTGAPWASFPDAAEADVDDAVGAARGALGRADWGGLTASQRGLLLFRIADVIERHRDELARLETRENGKLLREMTAQMAAVPGWLRYFGGLADKIEGRVIPPGRANLLTYTLREPLGVIGAVTPWNSPILLAVYTIAPALAAGNTVVVKPSEIAAAGVVRFAELAASAGLPPGVINVVTGLGPTGGALVNHPGVNFVNFTGSTETGRKVGAAATARLAGVTLELGGKSPNIVFDDADLDAASAGVLSGIFSAGGQSCIAGSRALVQRSIYDAFLDRLTERTGRIVIGDPTQPATEVGPVASRQQFDKIAAMVATARDEGSRVLSGGSALDGDGYFYQPTILEAGNSAFIARNEVFGPVLTVMPFDDEAEAVALANDTEFGLAAGVWTTNLSRAHRMARVLDAGTVWVNMYRASAANVPFGGFKDSGLGFNNGIEAINKYLRTKAVWCELGKGQSDPFVLQI
ncbi:MAG: aldehyde dehydrogenase [Rhodobacteraceae bacterium]|jgi:acyl-CoA reductase-like NAD-dependent aldehyde dehydrogenase|nr:aldehyde dehydrogenase [Paracoccaceae bacterium]